MRALPYYVNLFFTSDEGENGFMTSNYLQAESAEDALKKALEIHQDVSDTFEGSAVYSLELTL